MYSIVCTDAFTVLSCHSIWFIIAFAMVLAVSLSVRNEPDTASGKKFRNIVEASADPITIIDLGGKIEYVNDAFTQLFGYTKEDVLGRVPIDCVHPDDIWLVERGMQAILDGDIRRSETIKHKRKDGKYVQTIVSTSRLLDSSGKVDGITCIFHDITNIERLEAAMAEESERLAVILRSIGDGVIAVDNEKSVVLLNEVAEQLTGWSNDEAVGMPFEEVFNAVNETTGKKIDCPIEKVLKTGKLISLENHTVLISRAGTQAAIADSCAPIRDANGRMTGVVLVFRDVTEQKLAQQALKESETKFRGVFDQSAHLIGLLETDGTLMEANKTALDVIGVGREDVVGRPFWQTPWWSHSEETIKMIKDAIAYASRGHLTRFETVHVSTDGTRHHIDFTLKPVKDENGNVTLLIPEGRDITQRKNMEEELRWKSAFLEAQIDSTLDGILVVDKHGRRILTNQQLLNMWRVPEHVISDDSAISLLNHAAEMTDETQDFKSRVEYLFEHPEETWHGEIRFKDGTVFDRYTAPVTGKDGKYYGRIWTLRDITESKRAEEEKMQVEIQLRHAQKLESIGQLAAGIAHEINTPSQFVGDNLSFIRSGFESLSEFMTKCINVLSSAENGSIPSDALAEMVEIAREDNINYLIGEIPMAINEALAGVERITKIVGAMKEFSHPGTDEKVFADINRAIETTVTVARNEWKYVAEMKLDLDPNLPPIPCLPGDFNQVILNLVVNAAHAVADAIDDNGNTKGTITISTRLSGDTAEIRLSDTGKGIPEAIRSKVFDPFFTTKKVGKGTGQGLAIARSIINDKHGGDITFETREGKGTTFIIRLPIDIQTIDEKAA